MLVYFDIETVARPFTPGHREIARAKGEAKAPPYNNLKPENRGPKIVEYVDQYVRNKENNMALQPFSAQVVCICAIAVTNWRDQPSTKEYRITGPKEDLILRDFVRWLDELDASYPVFVGFNNRKFDMPVLVGAMIANSVRVPTKLIMCLDNPYKQQQDLFQLFPNAGGLQWISQSLGLEPLAGTGANVADWFDEENYEAIENHCADDVRLVRTIYERYAV